MTHSLGSKKNPISPLYTTGESLNSLASSGDSCICAYTHACPISQAATRLLGCLPTFDTHWSSRSTRVDDHAPAARTTLSAWYLVPSTVSTPIHVVPSLANKGCLKAPALPSQLHRYGRSLTYPPKPNLTPCALRYSPILLMALAAASQPPSSLHTAFQP